MAEPFRIFLSYNRRDMADVERLAQALSQRGITPFKDDWYLSPGEHWPSSLDHHLAHCGAVAVVIGPNGLGPWQHREVYAAIDREVRERAEGRDSFRVIPVLLSEGALAHAGLGFLSQNVWVEAWDPRAADLIVGAVEGKPPAELYDQVHTDPRTLFCPYRGLRVFREENQAFYFGREKDLDKLVAAVGLYPIVAIVGASGSGKSSLARAGLVPRLRRQKGGQVWQIAIVDHPGQDPFFALAQALLPLWEPQRVLEWSRNQSYQEAETLAASLQAKGASRLRLAVKDIFEEEPGTTDLLLIVDQWEELYTYRPEGASAFIDMLLHAVRERGIQVVLTLRADYWGELLTHHPPLAARLAGEATVHLPALLRGGLEAVIRKPAERTSLVVDPVLVEALLNDRRGSAGRPAAAGIRPSAALGGADGTPRRPDHARLRKDGPARAIDRHACGGSLCAADTGGAGSRAGCLRRSRARGGGAHGSPPAGRHQGVARNRADRRSTSGQRAASGHQPRLDERQ